MATLAALNLRVYQELLPLTKRAYDLDHQVSLALRHFDDDRERAVLSLCHCLSTALKLEEELPPELARIMKIAESESPG